MTARVKKSVSLPGLGLLMPGAIVSDSTLAERLIRFGVADPYEPGPVAVFDPMADEADPDPTTLED